MKITALIFVVLASALKAGFPAHVTALDPGCSAFGNHGIQTGLLATPLFSPIAITSPGITDFENKKIEMPPLMLSETKVEGCGIPPSKVITVQSKGQGLVSYMPVIAANLSVDPKIFVPAPDPRCDSALIIKEVDMTPSK